MRTNSVKQAAATAYVEPEPDGGPRLAHFPVTFFAVVMGLAGLSLAWTRAAPALSISTRPGTWLFWLALVVYLLVLGAYAAKAARYPGAVREELHHPVRLAFVPTLTIAPLLLAAAGLGPARGLSQLLWWFGMAGQLVLTLYVLSAWMSRPVFGLQHVTPAWFIPVVGTLAVPFAGVVHGPRELSWFFFSVGLVFWGVLLPMVFSRLFLHPEPVPARLLPTLAVLIAPPAVAFLAYLSLSGGALDTFARVLYSAALFFALLFVVQIGRLHRLPFFLSWWAYSFPLAALSAATTVMAALLDGAAVRALAWTLLVLVTALVALLGTRTLSAMARGHVCVPE